MEGDCAVDIAGGLAENEGRKFVTDRRNEAKFNQREEAKSGLLNFELRTFAQPISLLCYNIVEKQKQKQISQSISQSISCSRGAIQNPVSTLVSVVLYSVRSYAPCSRL